MVRLMGSLDALVEVAWCASWVRLKGPIGIARCACWGSLRFLGVVSDREGAILHRANRMSVEYVGGRFWAGGERWAS